MLKAKDKIIKLKKLAKLLARLRRQGKRVVFTNGCFDLLHVGHVRYLNEARQKGDVLVVAVNTDRSVRKIKGDSRPIIPQAERAEILSALAAVDFVTYFDEGTPFEIINELKPGILVKGADYRARDIVGNDFIKRTGGKLYRIPLARNYSTSRIVQDVVDKYGTK